jgi:hypothetical protein
MFYAAMWIVFGAVLGSFGTAYIHERTGRDVQLGGIIGALVGAVGGIFFLVMLWVWLLYGGGSFPIGRVYSSRRVWYRWWD